MTEYVSDCPRCGCKDVTFDVFGNTPSTRYDQSSEVFCVCRRCHNSTVFVLKCVNAHLLGHFEHTNKLLELKFNINGCCKQLAFISVKDSNVLSPPDFVPGDVGKIFTEAATCYSVECWNACSAMLRTALELATRSLLPEEGATPNAKTRRDLGLRLPWLFENGLLPADLQALSECIREDGNDGVHRGNLTKEDADDLMDFTTEVLRRLYTEPARVEIAKRRREERRSPPKS